MNTENKSFTKESIKDLYQTPLELYSTVDKEFKFDTDVASSDKNHLSNKWLTEHDNALECDWGDVNWCNPPYSNIMPWVNKAKEESFKGNTVVMLVPSDTSVKWFKVAYESCNEVRFISGRISFINADTQIKASGNNKGSVLFIWRGYCSGTETKLISRESLMGVENGKR